MISGRIIYLRGEQGRPASFPSLELASHPKAGKGGPLVLVLGPTLPTLAS